MNQKLLEAEALQESHIVPESLYDGRFSKTTQFMLPAIGVNVTNKLVFSFFENAFLSDIEYKHNHIRPIFMLFSIQDFKDINWVKVYSTLIKAKNFITEYDVGIKNGKYLLMMVFTVPKEFEKDYYNFRNGKYSLFSEEYKKKFPKYLDKEKKRVNIHWQIINKDSKLKEQIEKTFNVPNLLDDNDEIWELPRKEREFYRYKKKSTTDE